MNLTVDANVLVSELAGPEHVLRSVLVDSRIGRLLVAEKAWDEAQHELPKRFDGMVQKGRYIQEEADHILGVAMLAIAFRITLIAEEEYAPFEAEARLRMPDDPDDWHTVALALATDTGIWTRDKKHFFGCGIPVWSTPVIRAILANRVEGDSREKLSPDAMKRHVALTMRPIYDEANL